MNHFVIRSYIQIKERINTAVEWQVKNMKDFLKKKDHVKGKYEKKKVWLHLESKKCRLKRDTFFSLSDCHRLKRIVPSLASVWGKQGFSLIAHVNVHWTDVPME